MATVNDIPKIRRASTSVKLLALEFDLAPVRLPARVPCHCLPCYSYVRIMGFLLHKMPLPSVLPMAASLLSLQSQLRYHLFGEAFLDEHLTPFMSCIALTCLLSRPPSVFPHKLCESGDLVYLIPCVSPVLTLVPIVE